MYQHNSHAVHYIEKRGVEGVCTLVLCSPATVTSCIDACADSDKIPEDGTSTYILLLSVFELYFISLRESVTR
jgi:hypothetical protein